MKTLIFLIIICSCVAMGQSNKQYQELLDRYERILSKYNESEEYQKFIAKWQGKVFTYKTPLTLEDWDEYVIECWKDSVIFTREWYERDMAGNFYKSQVDTMWARKTKPTFPEFIEWLKRKNNGTQ